MIVSLENMKTNRFLAYKDGIFSYYNLPFQERNKGIILFKKESEAEDFLDRMEAELGLYTASMFRLYVFPMAWLPWVSIKQVNTTRAQSFEPYSTKSRVQRKAERKDKLSAALKSPRPASGHNGYTKPSIRSTGRKKRRYVHYTDGTHKEHILFKNRKRRHYKKRSSV